MTDNIERFTFKWGRATKHIARAEHESWPRTIADLKVAQRHVRVAFAAVAAVIALAGCDSTSDRRADGSAPAARAASDTAITARPVDREVYNSTAFLSPSRNIGCIIAPSAAGCGILERDWSPPPRPADCEYDYGNAIQIGSGEPAEFRCAGDSVINLAAQPLAYGDVITAGPIRCESAQSGITCRDVESGHGFSISREAYQLM